MTGTCKQEAVGEHNSVTLIPCHITHTHASTGRCGTRTWCSTGDIVKWRISYQYHAACIGIFDNNSSRNNKHPRGKNPANNTSHTGMHTPTYAWVCLPPADPCALLAPTRRTPRASLASRSTLDTAHTDESRSLSPPLPRKLTRISPPLSGLEIVLGNSAGLLIRVFGAASCVADTTADKIAHVGQNEF